MIRKELNFIVSSKPANGALNVSSDGARFEVLLEDPFIIDPTSENITVSVEQATIWWTVPNILTGINDLFRATDTGAGSGTAFGPATITIPQGLYDLTGLANAVERELVNAGFAAGIITFGGDSATQKVQITANYVGISIDFTIAQTFRDILGFNSQVLGPSAGPGITWLADNVAAFNVVNHFEIHSDLVPLGLRNNNKYTQIIAVVLIDVSPGSQIVFQPFNPARSSAEQLRGQKRTSMSFWLTDENNNLVNTAGEFWAARVVISYDVPRDVQMTV